MTRRILFVDDDPMVLRGLQRSLLSMRGAWDMAFVESGAAALEVLEKAPFDAVVSDMRMPLMSGAELLNEIQHRYPGTARLVLSGHADKDLILQCVASAHQFLTKPCDPEILKGALRRALGEPGEAGEAGAEACRSILAQVSDVPILPARVETLRALLEDPGTPLGELVRVVERDIGISSRVLKLTNNAFFGLRRRISTVEEALQVLGLETLKALVVQQGFMDQFPKHLPSVLDLGVWSDRSLQIARVAQAIAGGLDPESGGAAFGAGLLHKVGLMVLCAAYPERMTSLLEAESSDQPLWQMEQDLFGVDHAQVGGYLLGLWCLPDPLIGAVRFHLTPSRSEASSPVTAAVHGACALLSTVSGFAGRAWQVPMDRSYLEGVQGAVPVDAWGQTYLGGNPHD